MTNSDTNIGQTFHETTKYKLIEGEDGQPQSVMGIAPDFRPSMGEQSPTNEPHPFKVYTDLPTIELPEEFEPFTLPLLDAIGMSGSEASLDATPDLAGLARIGLLSNGILKRGSHGTGREIPLPRCRRNRRALPPGALLRLWRPRWSRRRRLPLRRRHPPPRADSFW